MGGHYKWKQVKNMDIIQILETFGVPLAVAISFGFFIWKQNKYIQDD